MAGQGGTHEQHVEAGHKGAATRAAHHEAAGHHEAAAQHHRKAAEHHTEGSHETAKSHATAAHEHSTKAHEHSTKAHGDSHSHSGNQGGSSEQHAKGRFPEPQERLVPSSLRQQKAAPNSNWERGFFVWLPV